MAEGQQEVTAQEVAARLQEVTERLEKVERLLGLQRMKQANEREAELRANSNVSDHCGSWISNHCAEAQESR
jgi:hypothetical protein